MVVISDRGSERQQVWSSPAPVPRQISPPTRLSSLCCILDPPMAAYWHGTTLVDRPIFLVRRHGRHLWSLREKISCFFSADTSRMLLKICELCSAARWFMRMWGVSLGQWMVWKECFGWCAFQLWCCPKKAGLTLWQQRRLPTLTAVSHTSQQLDTHQLPVKGDPSWAVRPRGGKCLLQTNPSATWRRILPSAIPPLPSPGSMLFLLGYIYII